MSISVGLCLLDSLRHLSYRLLVRYDVTDVQPERIQEIIEEDWNHLLQEKRVLKSPNYLREDGKPVIAIWGAQRFHSIFSVHLLNYVLPLRPWLPRP